MTSFGSDARSLLELLDRRESDGLCRYVSYDPRMGESRELTGADLARLSSAAAAGLQNLISDDQKRTANPLVALVMRDPLSFIVGFFAIMRAGLVPVPAPNRPDSHRGHRQRLRGVVEASEPRAILVERADADLGPGVTVPEHCPILPLDELAGANDEPEPADPLPSSAAYVQYTSGSISDPKPIVLRHENVLAQLAQAAEVYDEGSDCVSVSWVPLHHDMGLVTSVLRPLYAGYTSALLDAFDFVKEPALWPRALSDWKATHTSAPDFGYALCARKTPDPRLFDLRPLRVARSAGEPVRPRTLRAFAQKFRPSGFDVAAFTPSYGLAEATLTVTTCAVDEPPRILRLSARALRNGEVHVPASPDVDASEIVSCGRPLPGTSVEVVDPATREVLGPRQVGEVWISGPQVVPSDAHSIEGSEGHCTGDMGFCVDDELYLVGRARERFQVAGQNFYSGELEILAFTADDRLRHGRAAVFLGQLPHWHAPRLVVVAECGEAALLDDGTGALIAKAIVAALGHATGLSVHSVCLVPAGTVPVTTSGKIQREQCRTAFESGAIAAVYTYERGTT
ncbi:MAG: AMP-binding protein [Acidimicrobiales bacterium]